MELTFNNWICAQNILNTSEACFVELILALEMFYSYLQFFFDGVVSFSVIKLYELFEYFGN